MTDLIVKTYIAYLPIAILLTFIVARIFFKNSTIFMLDIFSGRQEIAMSTNKLFKTGFYLLSLGFALFMMKIDKAPFTTTEERWIPQETQTIEGVVKAAVGDDIGLRLERYREFNYNHQDLFEVLSSKVGLLAVVLGGMVFFLMYMLFRGKKKSAEGRARKLSLEKLPQI
jgi:hypothetical protein